MSNFWFVFRVCRCMWRELWHNITLCDGCQISAYKRSLKSLSSDLECALDEHYGEARR